MHIQKFFSRKGGSERSVDLQGRSEIYFPEFQLENFGNLKFPNEGPGYIYNSPGARG